MSEIGCRALPVHRAAGDRHSYLTGLSAPDSLGLYLTYAPRPGRKDAERNCISNVRTQGLTYEAAARKLLYLLTMARQLKRSGIELKDGSDLLLTPGASKS